MKNVLERLSALLIQKKYQIFKKIAKDQLTIDLLMNQ